MVKNNRGGLGRGLNSLLSGFSEERVASDRLKVEQQSPSPSQSLQTMPQEQQRDTKDSFIADTTTHQEHVFTPEYSVVAENLHEKAKESHVEQVVGDEQITIKSVSTRIPEEVPIDAVKPNPDQPRMTFKKEDLEELADSIEKKGLLQPILVRSLGSQSYQIIAGERRWQACKLAGMKTIPVRIRDANSDEALELALVENIQRSDLNPIEEAYGYRRIMEHQNLTQAELAQLLSKGRSTIANALRLLELPEDAQQLLFEEKITAGHARAILSVPTKEGRQKLTEKLVNEKLSVREAEAMARLLASRSQSSATSKREPIPKSYKIVARSLREVLKTNVKVKSSQGKNKIEIEFADEDDLERIFKEITENGLLAEVSV